MKKEWTIEETEMLLKTYLTTSREDILFNPPPIIQKMYDSRGVACPCVHDEYDIRLSPEELGHWEDCQMHKDWVENFKKLLQEKIYEILIKDKMECN